MRGSRLRQETVLSTIGVVESLVVALAPHARQSHLVIDSRSVTWEGLLSLQEVVVLFATQGVEPSERIGLH